MCPVRSVTYVSAAQRYCHGLNTNDYPAFHYCSWLFSWHAARDRCGPRHRGNNNREPPAKHSPRGIDWSALGGGPHRHDSRRWFGNHPIWPGDSAKGWSHNGIVGWADVDLARHSESVWHRALDHRDGHASAAATALASLRTW